MALVQPGDFTGKFSITLNGYKTTDFATYIERYEPILLAELLGVELYNLFIVDIELPLPDEIYTKLKEPFMEQPNCEILNSYGIVDMLCGFIYFLWLRDEKVQQTINGGAKLKGENSERSGDSDLFQRYNESVDTYKAIQSYIMENSDVYPTFKGIEKGYAYMSW